MFTKTIQCMKHKIKLICQKKTLKINFLFSINVFSNLNEFAKELSAWFGATITKHIFINWTFFPEVVSCSSLISVTVIFKYSDKKQLAEENVNLALVSWLQLSLVEVRVGS